MNPSKFAVVTFCEFTGAALLSVGSDLQGDSRGDWIRISDRTVDIGPALADLVDTRLLIQGVDASVVRSMQLDVEPKVFVDVPPPDDSSSLDKLAGESFIDTQLRIIQEQRLHHQAAALLAKSSPNPAWVSQECDIQERDGRLVASVPFGDFDVTESLAPLADRVAQSAMYGRKPFEYWGAPLSRGTFQISASPSEPGYLTHAFDESEPDAHFRTVVLSATVEPSEAALKRQGAQRVVERIRTTNPKSGLGSVLEMLDVSEPCVVIDGIANVNASIEGALVLLRPGTFLYATERVRADPNSGVVSSPQEPSYLAAGFRNPPNTIEIATGKGVVVVAEAKSFEWLAMQEVRQPAVIDGHLAAVVTGIRSARMCPDMAKALEVVRRMGVGEARAPRSGGMTEPTVKPEFGAEPWGSPPSRNADRLANQENPPSNPRRSDGHDRNDGDFGPDM